MNFLKQASKMASDASAAMEKANSDLGRMDLGKKNSSQAAPQPSAEEQAFDEKTKKALPAMVRMISGCKDEQTSADVSNTASFELPEDAGPGGAGGACTNSLLLAVERDGKDGDLDLTWVSLLDEMRGILNKKGYEQIPQLSSSRKLDLHHEKFSVANPNKKQGSKMRALLIGINYVGQKGELRGCHNDVISMKRYIEKHGFHSSDMRIMMDDNEHEQPTAANILQGIDWLTEDAQEGDSLFLHYSGHGGYVKDENGDEADGRDETLVPIDYKSAGQIIDDVLFKELAMPLPAGVQLTCIMDCCHSGTILDLPYMVKASEQLQGTGAGMVQNPGFSFEKLMKIAKQMYELKQQGGSMKDIAMHGAKSFMAEGGASGAMSLLQSSPGGNKPGKETGGLGNLMGMFGGGSGGKLPSLPF